VEKKDFITSEPNSEGQAHLERREQQPERPSEGETAEGRLAGRSVQIYDDKEDHSFVNGE